MNLPSLEHSVAGLIPIFIIFALSSWVKKDAAKYRSLIAFTTAATLVLIVLGAYVRLSDAGLGCPDWPGCYGNLSPQHAVAQIQEAEAMSPGGPTSMEKAWKEMLHRYLAMAVGSLIGAIMIISWRKRQDFGQSPALASITAIAVVFQAALGAWTVTLLLKPAIVSAHLLGGISIFSLLCCQLARLQGAGNWAGSIIAGARLRLFGFVALVMLVIQVCLGGWVSTNYAALACLDLPTCHGAWKPPMDFANAFHILRPLGFGSDGQLLTLEALTAIHWTHRVGAIIATLVVGGFGLRLLNLGGGAQAARILLALLIAQVLLGLSNIWFSLPLPVSVAHNGVATMLVAWLLIINLRLTK